MKLHPSTLSALAAATVFAGLQPQANAQPIALNSASNFAVLAGSGITVAGAVNSSSITGDIGTFPTPAITGLANMVLTGTNHAGDAVTQAAKNDLVTAYNTAAGRPATTVVTELGTTTKTAGVYDSATGTFGLTGILTLDGGGDPNAVFVFKTGSTLITATSSEVRLTNGAQANNVYWQVGSSATLGSSSTFKGNVLALTAITVGTSATVDGRLLARNSFVQLDGSNTIRVVYTAQTIAFAVIPNHLACDAPFTFVAPVATSGLPVTLTVSGPATVSGNTVTLTGGAGVVVLTATQPGDTMYSAAAAVTQSFVVSTCPQTITFAPIPNHTACEVPFTFVYPLASSGLPVTLAVSGPATVSGNTVTLTGAVGTVVLTATQAGNTNFAAAPSVAQSFVVVACPPAAQTIAFAPIAGHTACDAPFTFVYPLASSGLPVTLTVSGPATVSGNTVTLTGAVGTVVLTATQGGNTNFAAAPSVAQSFVVVACPPAAQTIAFAPILAHTACDVPFTFVAPVASSGLPVTLTVSGPATVSGNTVTLTGAVGTVVLVASQAGNTNFAAAPSVTQSFVVAACAPAAQTITFAPIASHTACDVPFTFVAPVASSGLPVTLTVSGPATISGNTVTLTGAVGTVVLTATQAGNTNFAPAASVAQSFVVAACIPAPTPQTITFAPIASHTACDVPFTFVAPLASSGLPVTLAVSGPATISGNTLTLTGALGTVVLTATQAGNSNFAPASSVTQSFVVTVCAAAPAAQTIAFAPIPGHTACDVPFTFVAPLASSGLPVTLTVSGPATVSGNTVTLTGAVGTVVLTATQAGNTNFAPAPNVAQSFVVAVCPPAAQTIAFAPILNRTACDVPFTFVAPLASSGLPVTLAVSGPATVSGNTITLTGAVGTVVLTATQAGNATFAAAPSVAQSFVVAVCAPAAQTIAFPPIPGHGACDAPFTFVLPVASSGLPVALAVSGPATVSGNKVTLTGAAGTVVLTATQAGNASFAPAPGVTQSFVAIECCIPPVITNNPLSTTGTVGTPFTYTLTATGSPTRFTAVNLPPGLSLNPVTGVISGTPTQSDQPVVVTLAAKSAADTYPSRQRTLGPTFVTITAANGDCYSAPVYLMIVIVPSPVPPVITSPGSTCPATVGTPFAFTVTASGSPTSFAASGLPAGLTLNSVTGAITGTPTKSGTSVVNLSATNSAGTGTGTLTLIVAPVSCIVNVSARMNVSAGEGTLIVGLTIRGSASKTVLIRGVGPTLSAFGVTGVLADPTIAVFDGANRIASNDNWETGASPAAQIAGTAAQVGAFALVAGSKDAALLVALPPGNYTVQLAGVGTATGAALVEVYDTQ